MKYTITLDVGVPVKKLIELFDNLENMYKWMEGLEKVEHLEGTPGTAGAKSKLIFQMGKRQVEMIETITAKNLPEEFSASYEAPGVFNIISNHFQEIDDSSTRYISEQEFQFQGLAMKVMGWVMPGAFKKQTLKHMMSFKVFAESQS